MKERLDGARHETDLLRQLQVPAGRPASRRGHELAARGAMDAAADGPPVGHRLLAPLSTTAGRTATSRCTRRMPSC